MSYKSINLEAVKNKLDVYYDAFLDSHDDQEVYVGESVNGDLYLAIQNGNRMVALSSIYDSKHAVDRFMLQYADVEDVQVLVVFGLESGEIVRRFLNEKNALKGVVVYEPSVSVFRKAIDTYDMTDILADDRVSIIIPGVNGDLLYPILDNLMDYENFEESLYIIAPKYRDLFFELEQQVYLTYRKLFAMRNVDQNTLIRHASLGSKNEIHSAKWLINAKNFFDLRGKAPSDVPCIVVASGPALEKNINELKKAQGKAFIFASDSAMPFLLKKGIEPDLVCTIDPQKSMNFKFIPSDENKVPTVFCPDADYVMLERLIGEECMCFSAGNGFFQSLFRKVGTDIPYYDGGGSVATCCFKLAYDIGFKTIIIIGQNLALEDGRLHAGRQLEDLAWDKLEVDGYYGGKVQTLLDFKLYLDWYEMIIPQCKGCEVINATEGGAMIHGAKQMPLSEAIGRYCKHDFDFRAVYNEVPQIFSTPELKKEFCTVIYKQKNYLKSLADQIQQLLVDYKRAGELYNKGQLSEKKAEKLNDKVSLIMQEITGGEASVMLYKRMIETELKFRKELREAKKSSVMDYNKNQQIMTDYLQKAFDACVELHGYWETILPEVEKTFL